MTDSVEDDAGHEPGDDWTCACGFDYFGGSAAYSWELYAAHLTRVTRPGTGDE